MISAQTANKLYWEAVERQMKKVILPRIEEEIIKASNKRKHDLVIACDAFDCIKQRIDVQNILIDEGYCADDVRTGEDGREYLTIRW